jgi:long-chain fatty acid transport protein
MSIRNTLTGIALSAATVFMPAAAQDLTSFELGARASGMAGAFAAKADDAWAVFANPAGLAFLGGVRLKTNLVFSQPNVTASLPGAGSSWTSSPFQFRGSLALSWQPVRRVSVGIGVFAPYSFESEWPVNSASTLASVEARLNALYIRPVLSAEIVRGLSLGFGVDFVISQAAWRHEQEFRLGSVPLPGRVGMDSRLELDGKGVGFSAGLLWKPHRAFQAGVRYVHEVPVEFTGWNSFAFPVEASWMSVPHPVRSHIIVRDLAQLFYRNQDFASRMTLPREIAGGVAFSPLSALSLHLEAQWNEWSRFGGWEFTAAAGGRDLSPAFTKELEDFYGVVPDYGLQTAGLVLNDAWKIKAGIEYRPALHFALRGGFAHHQSPAGEASLNPIDPTPGLNIAAIGFGYEGPAFNVFTNEQSGELSIDIYLRYARSGSGAGTIFGYELAYRAPRWEFGVGVGVNF